MASRMKVVRAALALVGIAVIAGCGSGLEALIAYTGGGLPPGEPDIGGVVLAQEPSAGTVATQEATGVEGAQVTLLRGNRSVGVATTGTGGYFRFEGPATGRYDISVVPPPGSGLRQAQRQVEHQAGQQTFLTILLERE